MARMKKMLLGVALAVGLMVMFRPSASMQDVNCAGSFTPSFNCIVTGLWDFIPSSPSTSYPVPFKAGGSEVTGIISASVDLTNAQVLALWSTPVTIVAAPGTAKSIDVVSVTLAYKYTGAYTSVSGNNLRLYYGSRQANNAASASITALGFLDATANTITRVAGVPDNTLPTSNTAVVIQNVNGVAYGGGNASNSVRVVVNYRIVNDGF